MNISKKVIFYTRRMLDGKYHIFKRIEIKPSMIVEELDVLFDHEDMADNYIKAKNLEAQVEEVNLG